MILLGNLRRLLTEDSGQDLVEYALLAALIAVGCVVAMRSLSDEATNIFGALINTLSAAAS